MDQSVRIYAPKSLLLTKAVNGNMVFSRELSWSCFPLFPQKSQIAIREAFKSGAKLVVFSPLPSKDSSLRFFFSLWLSVSLWIFRCSVFQKASCASDVSNHQTRK